MFAARKASTDKAAEPDFVDVILRKIQYSLVTNTRDLDFLFLLYFVVLVIDLFQGFVNRFISGNYFTFLTLSEVKLLLTAENLHGCKLFLFQTNLIAIQGGKVKRSLQDNIRQQETP